jgi:hypothetical protein
MFYQLQVTTGSHRQGYMFAVKILKGIGKAVGHDEYGKLLAQLFCCWSL